MVVLNNPVDQQGVGCTARHAVEVTSDEHGDVCAGCYLLQALEKCVHLYSIKFCQELLCDLGNIFPWQIFIMFIFIFSFGFILAACRTTFCATDQPVSAVLNNLSLYAQSTGCNHFCRRQT